MIAAVRADRTLDGKVDDADVTEVTNITRSSPSSGFAPSVEFVIHFIKTAT